MYSTLESKASIIHFV